MTLTPEDRLALADICLTTAVYLRSLSDDPLEVRTSRHMADIMRRHAETADAFRERLLKGER